MLLIELAWRVYIAEKESLKDLFLLRVSLYVTILHYTGFHVTSARIVLVGEVVSQELQRSYNKLTTIRYSIRTSEQDT